jgi:hypothetical protein
MVMTSRLRKVALTAHVTCSVGLLGGVSAFLVLATTGLMSSDAQVMRAMYIGMKLVAWSVVLPLVLAALLTGLIQSLGTEWGLFRHYWVLAKLGLTVLTLAVLLVQMGGIGHLADMAAVSTFASSDLLMLRRSTVVHASGGLLLLLVPVALSVFKPRGMTSYGRGRVHESRNTPRA